MTIKDIMCSGRIISEVPKIKNYSAVNVGFINKDGDEDETQLTVTHHLLTNSGEEELNNLFASLAKELGTTRSKVTYITVVASADSVKELERMGY